jgi:hypothetical protein
MGRPPIGKKPLTRTEIQRRWLQKRGQQRRAGPEPLVPSRSDRVEPSTSPACDQAADRRRIEELTRQLDQARQELAVALDPRAVGPDDPGRCFYCLKRQGEVKVMLKAARRRFTVFTTNSCASARVRLMCHHRRTT